MVAARKRETIRFARPVLVLLAGVVGVSSLAAPAGASSRLSVAASTLANVVSVASNSYSGSYCALLSTGKVDCWGADISGQLGNGTISQGSDVPVAVSGISDATAVASDADGNSFCAVLSTGHMKCWGNGDDGQLGNGTTTGSDVPVSVKSISTATTVVGGVHFGADGFCAVLSSKHLDCWGYGPDGELGDGIFNKNSDVPVAVHKITNAAALIGFGWGYCALLSTSHVDCWGADENGDLGDGSGNNSDVPVAVSGITDAKAVASDNGSTSLCALLSTGQVKCWGNDSSGQLGNGTISQGSDVPVAVSGISDATAVSGDHDGGSFCAVLSTGQLKCWGSNNLGQLGDGTTTTASVPMPVKSVATATGVRGTTSGFCALLSSKHLDCWGADEYGELGNGTFNSSGSDVPVAVHNITNAAGLISDIHGYCARLSTSHVDCWGDGGDGELGDGAFKTSDVPVAVHAPS